MEARRGGKEGSSGHGGGKEEPAEGSKKATRGKKPAKRRGKGAAGRVDGQAGEVGMGGFLLSGGHQVAAPIIVGFVKVI